MKQIITILITMLASCASPAHLHRTGEYKVAEAVKTDTGTQVKFEGIKGSYLLLSDTVKMGDKIIINVITTKN